jgi:hypothetical protein
MPTHEIYDKMAQKGRPCGEGSSTRALDARKSDFVHLLLMMDEIGETVAITTGEGASCSLFTEDGDAFLVCLVEQSRSSLLSMKSIVRHAMNST